VDEDGEIRGRWKMENRRGSIEIICFMMFVINDRKIS
jgi:hypothetical protein